jgi:hypothetical protein
MTGLSLPVIRLGGCAGSRAAMATVTAECPSSGCRPGGMAFAAGDDKFPAAVVRLLAMASAELDRHVNDRGWCRACRARFPCPRACLAGQILGWF